MSKQKHIVFELQSQ